MRTRLLFFGLLATYLPIAARNLAKSKAARMVTLWVAGLIVPAGLVMEGSGAVVSLAARAGMLKAVGG